MTIDEIIQFGLPPEDTVLAARKYIGEHGYDILHNCEHFANECAFGEKFSSMTENLRAKFWAIPIVHVYVARFPFFVDEEKILPKEREAEIASCSNPDVQSAKYYVWKLLERALMHSLGLKIKNLDFTHMESGKWTCSECCFSLSHCGNFATIAVSRKPIGVDIEKWDESRFTAAIAKKITTSREGEKIDRLEESARKTALNALWTKKEAVFKLLGDKVFHPRSIETSEYASVTKVLQCEERYLITVASEDAEQAVFLGTEELEFIDFDIRI